MPAVKSKSISVVSLWTDRIPETIDFYSRVLGFRRCACNGYHMNPPHFELDGAFLVLLRGQKNAEPGSEDFPALAITVESLEEACEALRENGVEVAQDIEEDESSRWMFLRDPGGNLLELAIWK